MNALHDIERPGDPEYMASLARGLTVLQYVAQRERPVTIAEASRALDLSRAAVRRCLYTLHLLGYVGQDVRGYSVRRKTAALGHPYLSLTAFAVRAQSLLDALRDELGESCSLGVIEDDALCYVARAEASRIMSVGLKVGSCLPLYPTSMGRVLLAGRSHEEQEAYFSRTPVQSLTPHSIVDVPRLLMTIRRAAADGYALVDQELELGLRSVAVPVIERGKVLAALNIGMSAARVPLDEVLARILPALRRTAVLLRPS